MKAGIIAPAQTGRLFLQLPFASLESFMIRASFEPNATPALGCQLPGLLGRAAHLCLPSLIQEKCPHGWLRDVSPSSLALQGNSV